MDGYIRVSRKMGREGESYISPTVQRDAIQRWADYKDITIGEWLTDEDWSGGTHDRPALKRGVQRALDGQTGGIVSWKIDRFSRTTEDGLRDLRRLRDAGARLAFVTEDIDTGTTWGKMIYTMLLSISEAFLENIKASWVEAKKRAAARGAYISRTPFGYRRVSDGLIEPDPVTAPIVQKVFETVATATINDAMLYLESAWPARSPWHTIKVRRMTSMRVYLGHTDHSGHSYLNTHPPIVTPEVWAAAQTVVRSRRSKEVFPLSGAVFCATCGAPMVGGRGGRGVRTYRCSASLSLYVRRGGVPCPAPPSILADRLEDYLRSLLPSMKAQVMGPGGDLIADVTERKAAAETELAEALDDLQLRQRLGHRYHDYVGTRIAAVEALEEEWGEAARQSQAHKSISNQELLADAEIFAAEITSCWSRVRIRRGRGLSVEDRVQLIAFDDDHLTGETATQDA